MAVRACTAAREAGYEYHMQRSVRLTLLLSHAVQRVPRIHVREGERDTVSGEHASVARSMASETCKRTGDILPYLALRWMSRERMSCACSSAATDGHRYGVTALQP